MPACAARLRDTAAPMIARRSPSLAPSRIASRRLTSFAPNRHTWKTAHLSLNGLCQLCLLASNTSNCAVQDCSHCDRLRLHILSCSLYSLRRTLLADLTSAQPEQHTPHAARGRGRRALRLPSAMRRRRLQSPQKACVMDVTNDTLPRWPRTRKFFATSPAGSCAAQLHTLTTSPSDSQLTHSTTRQTPSTES